MATVRQVQSRVLHTVNVVEPSGEKATVLEPEVEGVYAKGEASSISVPPEVTVLYPAKRGQLAMEINVDGIRLELLLTTS